MLRQCLYDCHRNASVQLLCCVLRCSALASRHNTAATLGLQDGCSGKDDSDDDATEGLATLRQRLNPALSVWHCIDAMPTMLYCMILQCTVLSTLGWDIAVLRCSSREHDGAGVAGCYHAEEARAWARGGDERFRGGS